jgi:hypothetical protein
MVRPRHGHLCLHGQDCVDAVDTNCRNSRSRSATGSSPANGASVRSSCARSSVPVRTSRTASTPADSRPCQRGADTVRRAAVRLGRSSRERRRCATPAPEMTKTAHVFVFSGPEAHPPQLARIHLLQQLTTPLSYSACTLQHLTRTDTFVMCVECSTDTPHGPEPARCAHRHTTSLMHGHFVRDADRCSVGPPTRRTFAPQASITHAGRSLSNRQRYEIPPRNCRPDLCFVPVRRSVALVCK